jgi:hypothetical protein
MKYYEPFQRLDNYVYIKSENALYIKSSVNVQLPSGSSLIGKDPFYENSMAATLEYLYSVDNSAPEPYIFEQVRLIKFLENFAFSAVNTDNATLTRLVRNEIVTKLGPTGIFTVKCTVYNPKNIVGGQVTNTISNDAEVAII